MGFSSSVVRMKQSVKNIHFPKKNNFPQTMMEFLTQKLYFRVFSLTSSEFQVSIPKLIFQYGGPYNFHIISWNHTPVSF